MNPQLEAIVTALHEYFMKYGKDRSIEYTYGYFDALGVLREFINEEKMK